MKVVEGGSWPRVLSPGEPVNLLVERLPDLHPIRCMVKPPVAVGAKGDGVLHDIRAIVCKGNYVMNLKERGAIFSAERRRIRAQLAHPIGNFANPGNDVRVPFMP